MTEKVPGKTRRQQNLYDGSEGHPRRIRCENDANEITAVSGERQ